jgi:hypothetical protein
MRRLIILIFYFAILAPNIAIANNDNSNGNHVAVVTEVIIGDAYTYIRCKENGVENWIISFQTIVKVGELIEYPDGPATYNFKSDTINKKFSKVYFVPGIRKITKNESLRNGFESDLENVYKDTDENGTLVFTDDSSKLPDKRRNR